MTHRARRRVARAGAVVALALLAATAWTLRVRLFAGNVFPVLPGQVFRSAQLSEAQLAAMIEARGLRSILNLRGSRRDAGWYVAEARVARERGVALHDLRLSASRIPSRQGLRDLLDLLEGAERPVLVHCAAGTDRTGLGAALALLLDGAGLEVARQQFALRYGYLDGISRSPLPDVLEQYGAWLAERGAGSTPARLREFAEVGYTPAFYDAAIEWVSPPPALRVGDPIELSVRVRNLSRLPWRFTPLPVLGVHLALRLEPLDEPSAGRWYRGETPDRALAPGGSIELEARLPPLERAGRYRLIVDLVDEEVALFSDMGSRPLERVLEVQPRGPARPLARPGDLVSDGAPAPGGAP